ncbi:hypothetical protein LCGC14_2582000, partial [marine sediment metagenome]
SMEDEVSLDRRLIRGIVSGAGCQRGRLSAGPVVIGARYNRAGTETCVHFRSIRRP